MDQNQAKKLFEKHAAGKLTTEELALLESWYLDWPTPDDVNVPEADISADLAQMRAANPYLVQPTAKRFTLWPRIAAAASILLVLSIGGYFLRRQQHQIGIAQYKLHDIAPGTNDAVLTLANGQKIMLSAAKIGSVTSQGNIVIKKTANGQIVYDLSGVSTSAKNIEMAYNTIETPRGGQYELILADGTKVWLNAASTLRYPVAFAANERRVELQGEGYFEVAKNKNKPFRVQSPGQQVEVLGTHFNVNAYNDDRQAKTTLLEGSVKLNAAMLTPGDQGIVKDGQVFVNQVNTEVAIAWTNGKFRFENENIKDLMRKISRWYNVDVYYEGEITHQDFSGSVSRFDKISKILDVLESTNTIHFKIEGRRLTVMP